MPSTPNENPSDADPAGGVLCAGLYSSGSTWVFNAVRALLATGRADLELRSLYFDSGTVEELEAQLMVPGTPVIKSHIPGAALLAAAETRRMPIILSLRDPRDAVASLMQRFDYGFEAALDLVAASADALCQADAAVPMMHIRYEDGSINDGRALRRVARRIGVLIDETKLQAIHANLSPGAVKSFITQKFSAGESVYVFDAQSLWHPRHVGDGRSGKFREALSVAQITTIGARLADYDEKFGYSEQAAV